MDTSTLIWIIIAAVAALLVVAALAWLLQRKRTDQHRHEAATVREHAVEQAHQAGEREALADEAAANARGMQAQAEAKAAVAARLQHGAATRREEALSARADVDKEFERADSLDPDSQHRNDSQRRNGAAESNTRPSGGNDRAAADRHRTTDPQVP